MFQNRFIRRSTAIFLSIVLGVYAVLAIYWTIWVGIVAGLIMGALGVFFPAILGWYILTRVLYLRAKRREDDDLPELETRMHVATALLIFTVIIAAVLFGFFIMAVSHM